MIDCQVIIQARMSSARFPGKMLAPLARRPLVAHVIARAIEAVGGDRVVVATSLESSDDPLAAYVAGELRIPVFRGDLDNVVLRFQECLKKYPSRWFVRVCGDSPVIDPELIKKGMELRTEDTDLVTNVAVRTFPPGQSVEVIQAQSFAGIDAYSLVQDEREHLTLHYYRNPATYRIRAFESGNPELALQRMVVDSLEDLQTLDVTMGSNEAVGRGFAEYARSAE